jgi:hypothetical protein
MIVVRKEIACNNMLESSYNTLRTFNWNNATRLQLLVKRKVLKW